MNLPVIATVPLRGEIARAVDAAARTGVEIHHDAVYYDAIRYIARMVGDGEIDDEHPPR